MFTIIVTTILVSAFIILFFEPNWGLQNKKKNKIKKKKEKPDSTIDGFIEDTDDAFINPRFPTQLIKRDAEGNIKPVLGDIGTFVPYSSIPEYHWLHGFSHKKAK